MKILLATVSKGREEAERRVQQLNSAFGGHEFKVVDHDTRHQIELVSGTPDMLQSDVDQMRRIAGGAAPAVTPVDTNDPKTTDTGRATGGTAGGGTATGAPASPAV